MFIALERGGLTHSALADADSYQEPTALAAITASELLIGVYRANTAQRRLRREAFVEAILEAVPVFSVDLMVARVHAVIWSQLRDEGHSIGAHDMLIAATAVAHGYAVLTDNVREFCRVPRLEVLQPNWQ